MSLWWNDSMQLIMDKDDAKILREMNFIARSLIAKSTKEKKILQSRYEKRVEQIF